eukprot:gnl/MRDRNA2_/MRDRNA2_88535_c0_seq1.p1 gnl/MRDRNA2_/MRDRNA2_88535_c0~~gnl/MRDRNA2_/MRDRNA2_88535_c0_seq1.p1  ORF type:complete len:749 (-),score=126.08 gnl/MRDRNA2_/MRDRNA2_88535_c0_seq1:14-2260(-)
MFSSIDQSSIFDSVCEPYSTSQTSHSTGVSQLRRLIVPTGILPQLHQSKAYSSTASTCEPSTCESRIQSSASFLTMRANKRAGEYEDFSRKYQNQQSQGPGHAKRGHKAGHGTHDTEIVSDTEKASAEFQATLGRVLNALGREQDTEAIAIGPGEQRSDNLQKGGGHKYYKVPLPPRPVQVRFEIWKRPAGVVINAWASTDEERPSARNWQLKARDDVIVYQHILPDSISVVPGGSAPSVDTLYVCVEGTTEINYEVRVQFSAVKVQLSKEQLQQRIKESKTSSVVEQRIQELQKNAAKKQEFEEELIRRKREKAEEMGKFQDIKLRNAKLAVTATRLSMAEQRRIAAINYNERLEQVSEKHAQNLENLHKRRIMWVQREQTRRQERAEQERIREEAEAIASRVKDWLTTLSWVSFAVNVGQRYKAKLEAIAQRERESHAAGKIGSEFLKFWSVRRRTTLYKNVLTVRAGIIAFIRQTNLCVHLWAAPIVADFMSTRIGDSRTSGSVTIQIKAFMVKIRRMQERWRKIRTVRLARVAICIDFFRDMEHEFLIKRRKEVQGRKAKGSAPVSEAGGQSGRLQFPGGNSKITGDLQAAASVPRLGRSSTKKRGSLDSDDSDIGREKPEDLVLMEALPEQVVTDALYQYFARRQGQYYDDLKAWHQRRADEQFDLDLQAFTASDNVNNSTDPKPSPMDPCYVKTMPKEYGCMFQVMEDTRFRWEMQMIKELQSHPEHKYKLTKRKTSQDPGP